MFSFQFTSFRGILSCLIGVGIAGFLLWMIFKKQPANNTSRPVWIAGGVLLATGCLLFGAGSLLFVHSSQETTGNAVTEEAPSSIGSEMQYDIMAGTFETASESQTTHSGNHSQDDHLSPVQSEAVTTEGNHAMPEQTDNNRQEMVFESEKDRIKKVRIDVAAGKLTIKKADQLSLSYIKQISPKISTHIEQDTLVIKVGAELSDYDQADVLIGFHTSQKHNNNIDLTIPSSIQAIEAKVETGDLIIQYVSLDTLDLDLTTGTLIANNLITKTCTAKTQIGNIQINSCKANEMNLIVDAGEVDARQIEASIVHASVDQGEITLSLAKPAKLLQASCDMGSCSLRVPGKQDDYSITAGVDMGTFLINGKKAQGMHTESTTGKTIEAAVDMGTIELNFDK